MPTTHTFDEEPDADVDADLDTRDADAEPTATTEPGAAADHRSIAQWHRRTADTHLALVNHTESHFRPHQFAANAAAASAYAAMATAHETAALADLLEAAIAEVRAVLPSVQSAHPDMPEPVGVVVDGDGDPLAAWEGVLDNHGNGTRYCTRCKRALADAASTSDRWGIYDADTTVVPVADVPMRDDSRDLRDSTVDDPS
jgi:hypothetical protein